MDEVLVVFEDRDASRVNEISVTDEESTSNTRDCGVTIRSDMEELSEDTDTEDEEMDLWNYNMQALEDMVVKHEESIVRLKGENEMLKE